MQTLPANNDPWLTAAEAAELAGCTAETIRHSARTRVLRASGTPGRWRFRRSWIEAWMNLRDNQSTGTDG